MKEKKGVESEVGNDSKNTQNKISMKLVLGVIIIAVIVSLIISWIVVSSSQPNIKDFSYDSGRIVVQIKPDFASQEGKIVVEVEGDEDVSVEKEVSE